MRTCWESYFDVGDEEDVIRFARSINTKNPLHLDIHVARQKGLLGIVVPGVMIQGFVDRTITEEIQEVTLCQLDMKFKNRLYPGALVSVLCTVLQRRQGLARVGITIKNGFQVIAEGCCLLLLSQKSV